MKITVDVPKGVDHDAAIAVLAKQDYRATSVGPKLSVEREDRGTLEAGPIVAILQDLQPVIEAAGDNEDSGVALAKAEEKLRVAEAEKQALQQQLREANARAEEAQKQAEAAETADAAAKQEAAAEAKQVADARVANAPAATGAAPPVPPAGN